MQATFFKFRQLSVFHACDTFLIIYLDATDDDLDNYEESQDPQPIRFRRFRLRRLRLRRIRVRLPLRRLKCPLRCASYYTCLAKTSGLGKHACLALKKHCYCWEECCFKFEVFQLCLYSFLSMQIWVWE